MSKPGIGLVGLAVMGENLALNIESKGFPIAVWNRTTEKVKKLVEGRAKGKQFTGCYSPEEFVKSIERPRKIIIMVKAGKPVDDMIQQLVPFCEEGDILIDGGNTYYTDTERRTTELEAKNLRFIGTGVSGGEEGALKGPSIMPGGQKSAYDEVGPIFEKIAAQVDDGPCCTYIGPGGAGHFVKMVHNGIEYGDMQLIAEAYDIMQHALGLTADELHEVFAEWNEGELSSFLIEITRDIFARKDDETGKPLVDLILDKAGQKGTGKWTSQLALDYGVAVPTIASAVNARILSAFKSQRVEASKQITPQVEKVDVGDKKKFIEQVRQALYASKICSYAQGMQMMQLASEENNWNLNLGEICRIWKGGCIIRAQFLDKIKAAFQRQADLPNLLLDPEFKNWAESAQPAWRNVVATGMRMGIPTLAFSNSIAYFDSIRRDRLPQNLTQAQRDYFGAHTYERVDKPEGEFFHTEWLK